MASIDSLTHRERAVIDLAINLAKAAAGTLLGARQPASGWDWILLVGGMVLAVHSVWSAAYKENPKSAGEIDQAEGRVRW